MGKANPFRYRGYYYDRETGFYYLQSRYYDPEICRFISADNLELVPTLSQTAGQLNLYAYCNNNPVMYSDENGESILTIILVAAGILTSGVINGLITADGRLDGESYWGSFLGGFIDGAIGGVAIAAGVATGGFWGFAITAGLSFVGGFTGNVVSQAISYGNVDKTVAFVQGGISALYNSFSYIGMALAGITSGTRWIDRFIDAAKISEICVGISVYLASYSFPNINALRRIS